MAKKKEQWAGYWLDESYSSLDLSDRGASAAEALRLAGVKRAIANFVRIVTGKNIPVLYSSGADSYTEGTVVVISASTKQKTFDSVVGLALHEASHNLLSNFEFLRNFKTYSNYMIPKSIISRAQSQNFSTAQLLEFMRFVMNVMEDRWIDFYMYRTAPGYRPYYEAMYDSYFRDKQIDYALQTGKYRETTVDNYLFYITNMTNPWFDTRALPDLDLIYGMIDLPNVSRFDARKDSGYRYAKIQCDMNASQYDLSKMPAIFQTCVHVVEIVLENTDPLKKASEQPKMSSEMQCEDESKEDNLDIPYGSQSGGKSVAVPMDDTEQDESDEDSDDDSQSQSAGAPQDSSDSKGSGNSDDAENDSAGGDSKDTGDEDEDEDKSGGKGADDGDESKKSKGNDESDDGRKEKHAEDTPSKQGKVNDKKLEKAIEKQKEFLDGNVKKKKVSKSLNNKIQAVEQSGATTVVVPHGTDYEGTKRTEVLVMRELTRSIMESGAFPFTPGASRGSYRRRGRYSSRANDGSTIKLVKSPPSDQAVQEGLRAGAILAQRLSIRNQNQLTKYNRRPRGSLDKRRLASLGSGDESVFYRLKLTEFKPIHLHMTLDASGSMCGNPWKKALTVAVAVAVAAEKIENLELTISMRAAPGDNYATIAIIYDSRKDKVSKIKQLFPYLCTNGITPEGLTFAAIMNELLNVKADDKYFINLSDGMPWYEGYSGESAYRHTREQVNRLKDEGIKVLSYFITEGRYGYTDNSSRTAFNKMYGKDASFIDVQKLPSLVATLNKLFLER